MAKKEEVFVYISISGDNFKYLGAIRDFITRAFPHNKCLFFYTDHNYENVLCRLRRRYNYFIEVSSENSPIDSYIGIEEYKLAKRYFFTLFSLYIHSNGKIDFTLKDTPKSEINFLFPEAARVSYLSSFRVYEPEEPQKKAIINTFQFNPDDMIEFEPMRDETERYMCVYQEAASFNIDEVRFTAVSQKKVKANHYAEIDIYASIEKEQRDINEIIKKEFGKNKYKTKESGFFQIPDGTELKIVLSSEDVPIDDNCEKIKWTGKYGKASFQVHIPEKYGKPEIKFNSKVFCGEIPICKLAFIIKIKNAKQTQPIETKRFEKAFISYASEDRERVFARLQGMARTAPYLDFFIDVLSLRSGQDWEKRLKEEITVADLFFLFWSRYALESEWVDKEWRYAYNKKGIEFIEPIPLDSPDIAPVPEELKSKHFNDLLLIAGKY
jgi:hypothetical protein